MANSFKRKLSANVGITFEDIGTYVVPAANVATIIGLSLANTANTGITVDVTVNAATQFFVVKSAPIPVGGSLVVVGGDQKIVLESGDSIRVKSDTATSVDAVLSILETTL